MSKDNAAPQVTLLEDRDRMIQVIRERLERAGMRELRLVFWYVIKHCK